MIQYLDVNGNPAYVYDAEKYVRQTYAELAAISTSTQPQVAMVGGSGDGAEMYLRLPGGDWTKM